jgi:hypothetical protein
LLAPPLALKAYQKDVLTSLWAFAAFKVLRDEQL